MASTPAAVLEDTEPDDLVVIVAPEEACDHIETDVTHLRARFGADYENQNQQNPTNVAQLRAEIDRLERELERERAQLDAVITRYERILAERTNPTDEQDRGSPLERARRWTRGLLR